MKFKSKAETKFDQQIDLILMTTTTALPTLKGFSAKEIGDTNKTKTSWLC